MAGPNEEAVKLPKSKVDYEHPAQGDEHCGICEHYEGKRGKFGECAVVRGIVRSEDWCKRFKGEDC